MGFLKPPKPKDVPKDDRPEPEEPELKEGLEGGGEAFTRAAARRKQTERRAGRRSLRIARKDKNKGSGLQVG